MKTERQPLFAIESVGDISGAYEGLVCGPDWVIIGCRFEKWTKTMKFR